jgi:hypothetical protein
MKHFMKTYLAPNGSGAFALLWILISLAALYLLFSLG